MESFWKETQKNEYQTIWVGTECRHISRYNTLGKERHGVWDFTLCTSQSAYYYVMDVHRKHFPGSKTVDLITAQQVALVPCIFIGSLASLSLMDPDGYCAHSRILYNTAEGHSLENSASLLTVW